ncbi:hypothetical protein STEG23_019631 [Scotinomys teguina]
MSNIEIKRCSAYTMVSLQQDSKTVFLTSVNPPSELDFESGLGDLSTCNSHQPSSDRTHWADFRGLELSSLPSPCKELQIRLTGSNTETFFQILESSVSLNLTSPFFLRMLAKLKAAPRLDAMHAHPSFWCKVDSFILAVSESAVEMSGELKKRTERKEKKERKERKKKERKEKKERMERKERKERKEKKERMERTEKKERKKRTERKEKKKDASDLQLLCLSLVF